MKIIITAIFLVSTLFGVVHLSKGQSKETKESITPIDAFPFKLESYDGKIYTLKDFKGKVIICKFWVLGCSPCAYIEKIMRPLKERYKESKDIVFLSVFADSERARWQQGLGERKYTSETDLQLTTGGIQHPLLKYYGYTGFPQILLIDKKGKLISSKGLRPIDASSLAKFDAVIQSNL